MDFFSKVGDITKTIGDKTVDAFQAGKLHVKLNGEEHELNKLYQRLGAYIYEKRNAGMVLDEEAEAICKEADVHAETIRNFNDIKRVKKQQFASSVEKPEGEEEPGEPKQKFCSGCGKKVEAGAVFCSTCGNKVG